MFGNFVVETAQAGAGLGAFALNGPAANTPYISMITARGNGSKWVYLAESTITKRWEILTGAVTAGSPNTLSRTTTLESWDGVTRGTAAINWTANDGVLRIIGIIPAQVIDGVISWHRGSSAPAWAVPGTIWIDDSAEPSLVFKQMKADGATWATLFTFDESTGLQLLAGNATVALGAVPKQQAESIAAAAALAATPVGSIAWWPTDTAPTGWLARDGSLISRTTYAALFAVLVTAPGFTGQTFTVTIASPGVVTKSSHGFTGGERLRLSTTGALPTGLDTTSDFFVIYVDANTFQLATSEANAAAGTAINTTGSQSGTHTYTRSLFGLGDGSTTFKLPDDRDIFIRGKASSGRAIGSYRSDAMQGHRHNLGQTSVLTNFPMRNALGSDEGLAGVNNGAGSALNDIVVHDPVTDGTNGTPRIASETRPVSRAYLPIIKYQ